MNLRTMLPVAALPLLTIAGCATQPVSRLSPQERAQAIAVGKQIDAAIMSTGVKTEVGSVENRMVPIFSGNIACRVYRPANPAPTGTVVFIHGGAWVGGSIDYHDNMARLLCATSEAAVISIEYSRTPGAMFPRQLDEIRSVMLWLQTNGSTARLFPDPVAVCGDSAGGNMAAVIARDSAPHSIALAVLINPVVDLTLSTLENPDTRGFSELMVNAYLPKRVDASTPDASPLLHPVPVSHPATFIAIGDQDPWRPEQDLYAAKLKAAGVTVELLRTATGHLGPDGAQATPTAIPTLTAAGKAIKSAFAVR